MTDIVEFLRARIAEDEAAAGACVAVGAWIYSGGTVLDDRGRAVSRGPYAGDLEDGDGAHIARWDPARVLAECDAKRVLIELHTAVERDVEDAIFDQRTVSTEWFCRTCVRPGADWLDWEWFPCPTLLALALPFADHDDYDEARKP